jgi:hypothetical protein
VKRNLTVTLTLSGTCPEAWDQFPSAEIKARAEAVSEDMARKIFANLTGLVVASTATVDPDRRTEGGHE